MLQEILDYVAKGISIFSISIIIYGAVLALISFIRGQMKRDENSLRDIRIQFGGYLLLGLELLIGADIIRTIIEPSYEELIVLAGIVVIRTIMSVFLNREIKELEKNGRKTDVADK